MHIGIIPARAGSTRFPGKNRAKLGNIPLWKIGVNKSLKLLDKTIVNTDDDLILMSGAKCMFYLRPGHLRDGTSYRIDDVLIDMAKTLNFDDSDIIHLFQPTNPFIGISTVLAGKEAFNEDIDSVQSIWKVPNTLHAYSQRKIDNGFVEFADRRRDGAYNSQRKPDYYAFAGYVACKVRSLFQHGNIWGEKSVGIEVNQIEAIDIDTKEDYEFAKKFI